MIQMALVSAAVALGALPGGEPTDAKPPAVTYESAYTADLASLTSGSADQATHYLDNFSVAADADLDRLWGWKGVRLHGSVLANHGYRPNDDAGTLQGIDNIEVADPGVRLFEFWVEKEWSGGAAVLAGLYDVNSEFYRTESAALFIGPQFGVGSELAATGPNGPSIFPSTALAVRARLGRETGFHLQAAVVGAEASTLGDAHGIDTRFDNGLLMIAEAGWNGPVRIAGGAWRYSDQQPDIRRVDREGQAVNSAAQGAYVLLEGRVYADDRGREATAFVRAGVSDGNTTDFGGGWQAGINVSGVIPSRPSSALAAGFHRGLLSGPARANIRDAGGEAADAEQGFEITVSDQFGRVRVQPDLQIISGVAGDSSAETVVVAIVRFTIEIP